MGLVYNTANMCRKFNAKEWNLIGQKMYFTKRTSDTPLVGIGYSENATIH